MKKIKTTIQTLATLLVAVVATTACSSSDDNIIGELPTPDIQHPTTNYTMTVEATKGGDDVTRALSLSDDGKTLYGKWKEGEQVWVYKKDKGDDWEIIGHLSPTNISADGLSCTLTGSFDAFHIDGADGLEVGDMLKLELGNDVEPMFIQQDGSLQLISDNYDYNLAMVTVGQVSTATAGGETVYSVTTTGPATFEPQVAIVRFNLQNKAGRPLTANYIYSSLLPTDCRIATPSTSIYVAVRPTANSDVSLRVMATEGGESIIGAGDWYTYSRSGVTLEKGKFYDITVKMNRHVYLNYLSSDFTAQDGDIFEKTINSDYTITIPDGATVTLQGAGINDESKVTGGTHAGITCLGDATIILDGTSIVRSFGSGYPAIKPGGMGSTLTIKGNSGTLQAYGGDNATAIGGSSNLSCGNILISGGTVEATGGTGAPAIGNYGINSCGTITIDNTVARVTATKGSGATNSIGFAGAAFGSCGQVTIGGTVYWDGSAYQNDGEAYLARSPLTYQP